MSNILGVINGTATASLGITETIARGVSIVSTSTKTHTCVPFSIVPKLLAMVSPTQYYVMKQIEFSTACIAPPSQESYTNGGWWTNIWQYTTTAQIIVVIDPRDQAKQC